MDNLQFCLLHNHTEYSNMKLRDCLIKTEALIQKAIDLGYNGVAITDHEILSGHVSALKIYDKIKKEHPDFKLMLGNEIYLIDENDYRQEGIKFYHFLLIAKDRIGYQQMRELSSRAWDRSYFEKGQTRVPTFYKDIEEIVGNNPGHIVASSACFTKGHKVTTLQGEKNIENVNSSDLVLTHDGTYQKVISPTRRFYNGKGNVISFSKAFLEKITCTENHKFLVVKKQNIYKKVNEKRVFSKIKKELQWKEAKDLKKGELCLLPFPSFSYTKQTELDIAETLRVFRNNLSKEQFIASTRIKSKIQITPNFMRMFGLWLGDGWVASENSRNQTVGFSFNEKEFDLYFPFVKEGLKEFGEFSITIDRGKDQHRVEAKVRSIELCHVFRSLTNNGKAHNKFIPEELKHISKELDAELLYGYLLADGYYRARVIKDKYISEETVDATVSKQLFDDITSLYHSIGFIPSPYTVKEHKGKDGVNHRTAYYHTSSRSFFSMKNNKQNILEHEELIKYLEKRAEHHLKGRGAILNGVKYIYNSIKTNESIMLNEEVYCLNVEKNHSFVCNNIIVHNCLGSEISQRILKKDGVGITNFINWCKKIFGEGNFFLEMQDSDSEEQRTVNQYMLQLSEHFKVPYTLTSDVHYLNKEDITIHNAFLNSKEESERETFSFYATTYIKTLDEMRNKHLYYLTDEQFKTAVNNTQLIYNMVESYDIRHSIIVPRREPEEFQIKGLFRPHYDKYKNIELFEKSEDRNDRYLIYLLEQGLIKKNWELTDTVLERLDTELDIIWFTSERLEQKLSSYLILVRNIIDIIWEFSTVGTARGSCAGFLTNYLLEISQVDPLKYNLPYWRFANKERIDLFDIDIDFSPTEEEAVMNKLREYFGHDNILNTVTLKTESLKSAILTAARGLGISVDEAQAISSMVPMHRGQVPSFSECLFGDEEKDVKPLPGFETEIRKHEGLYEAIENIENIISGRGVHASASYVFNDGYVSQNSLMRSPNGQRITSLNMKDSDDCGGLKVDLLKTEAQTKIMVAMNLLLEDGLIEWQGTLRDTYNKYLHPDVLVYDDMEMWRKAADGEIINLFQFETMVGGQAIKKLRPTNVEEMALVNDIMRLMSEDGEQPMDRYARFKADIGLWYKEMEEHGLTEEEVATLEKYLLQNYGNSAEQEDLMQILMEPKISNFSLGQANNARKILAKKLTKQVDKLKEDFYKQGLGEHSAEKN